MVGTLAYIGDNRLLRILRLLLFWSEHRCLNREYVETRNESLLCQIYVKFGKLDIMIRLASQANIAQVLSELKEYADTDGLWEQ
ncbi:hypothetical protein M0804_013831 [Polistes exclamans]|nr:hypothetical protein M0804_013831 [Polistes exclamans]